MSWWVPNSHEQPFPGASAQQFQQNGQAVPVAQATYQAIPGNHFVGQWAGAWQQHATTYPAAQQGVRVTSPPVYFHRDGVPYQPYQQALLTPSNLPVSVPPSPVRPATATKKIENGESSPPDVLLKSQILREHYQQALRRLNAGDDDIDSLVPKSAVPMPNGARSSSPRKRDRSDPSALADPVKLPRYPVSYGTRPRSSTPTPTDSKERIEDHLESIRNECTAIHNMAWKLEPEFSEARLATERRRLEAFLESSVHQVPSWVQATRELAKPQTSSFDPFKKLFTKVDANRDGKIQVSELKNELQEVPPLAVSQSPKLHNLAAASSGEMGYEEFRSAVDDLYTTQYKSFCKSAGEAFAGALFQSLDKSLHSGKLGAEGDSFQALKRLGEMPLNDRAMLMWDHSLGCLPEVVAHVAHVLEAEAQYYREQQANSTGKFDGDMILCDDWIFTQGLEKLIGFPEFSKEDAILQAICREHTEGKHAKREFTAFNSGRESTTTPKEQWDTMLPGGLGGLINVKDYGGEPMMNGEEVVTDFMEHPTVKKAGLTKYEVIVLRLYTGPMFREYNDTLRKIGSEFEKQLQQKLYERDKAQLASGVRSPTLEITVQMTNVTAWGEEEQEAFKETVKSVTQCEVTIQETLDVIGRRLRLATTLEVTVSGQRDGMEKLNEVSARSVMKELKKLSGAKSEGKEGAKGFANLSRVKFIAPQDPDENAMKEEALADARSHAGQFPYVTTVHAITSALIKVSRVTPVPAGGKVFRGMAGRNVAERFLRSTESGSRVGDELGFMSTTTEKKVALGYIQKTLRHKQMYEIDVGQIDRGADIDFLSLFPGEKEILFPPNSCLEVVGAARYEYSEQGVVLVWPLRVNINLKSLTIEDFQAMRKKLLLEAASNTLHLVDAYLEKDQTVDEADRTTIRSACQTEVTSLHEPGQEEYNDDTTYCIAYEWLTDIRPLAEDAVALAKQGLRLEQQNPRQQLVKLTEKLLASTGAMTDEKREEHAEKLCRMKKLYRRHKEEVDVSGCTPLLHWAQEGYFSAVGLLLDAGADRDVLTPGGDTTLHVAARHNHQHVVKEWTKRCEVADTEKINPAKNTPLMEAAIHGSVAATGVLLEFGAKVNFQRESDGKTALYLAAEKGHGGVLQELLKFGAKIELTSKKGTTALLAAAEAGSEEAFDALMRGGADMDWDTQLPQRVLERLDVFALLFKDAYYYKLLEFAEKPEFKAGLLQASGQSTYLTKLEAEFAKAETPDREKAALDNFVKVARYLMDVGAPEHLAAAYGVMLSGLDKADGGQEKDGAIDKVAIAKVKMLGLLNELYGRKRYSPSREGFNSVSECIKVLGEARKVLERLSALKDDDTLKDELTLEEATVFEGTGYLYLFSKKLVLAEQRKSSETTEDGDESKEEYTAEFWFQKEIAALYPFQALGLPNPLAGTEAQEEPGFRREVLEDMPKSRIRKLTDALNALGTAYEMKLKVDKPENKQEHMAYKLALVSYRLSVEVGTDCGANHEDVARSLMSRGNFSVYVGEKHTAKSDLQESVRMFEMSLGKKHPRTVGARNALAKFLSRFEVFAWLCSEGGHAEVLDLAKSVPEFKQLLIKDGQCVYLADLEAAFQRAEPREKKAALDNLTRVAQFLVDITGPDFLAAGHATLLQAMALAQTEIETSDEPSVKLAKVKMLGGLNELYGRKKYKPTADFEAVERQKDVLKEARKLLEDAAALKEDEQHQDDMILEEAIVLEGTGYLYLFNKDKVMSDADKERQRFGEYWFKREITVLYPEEWDVDGSLSFDNAKVKTLKNARVRRLADALNALGTAYEIKLKGAAKDSAVPISELEWFTKAHLAYTKSIEVAELSANQADLARSYMSRGNLLSFAGEKEGAVQDLEKCVRKFRDALGDSHPRTKAAYTALSNLLTQLDFFMWATNQHGQTRMLELAKGNAEFNLRLVGIDPQQAAVPAAPVAEVKSLRSVNLKREASNDGIAKPAPDMKTRCCYLDALEKQFETAATPSAKKEVLENFVKVAWFLMDLGGPACLEAAYRVLRSGVDFAEGAISDAEVKAGKVKILAVLNELHGRKKYQPVVDFNAIEEQRQVLDEARTLLDQTASLKESEAYKEDLILDEAMVLEGTGYLYLFNKDKVMSDADKERQRFGEYWFKREITVLYPEEWDVDGSLSFDNAKVKTLKNARVRKLADALNALGTAYEIKLKEAAKASNVQVSEHEFFAKALQAYDKSVEVAKFCGCAADLARSHMSRGNLYKYASLKEKALTDLEKSVELFEDALGEGHTRTKSARKPLEELRSIMAPKLPDTPRAASAPRK